MKPCKASVKLNMYSFENNKDLLHGLLIIKRLYLDDVITKWVDLVSQKI